MMSNLTTSKNEQQTTTTARIPWIVRPSTIDDKDAIEAVMSASYGNLLKDDYDTKLLDIALPNLCHVRPELLTSNTWYIVEHPYAKDETGGNMIVGCGGWTPQSPMKTNTPEDEADDIPHLRHFATRPDFLRKGVARAIWDRIWKDWCEYYDVQNSGKSRPHMEVFSTLSAESFYKSLGFEKVKEITIPFSGDCPFPAVLMRRPDTN
jgi:GNAT superfamily N-acetyltransferase